MRNGTRPVELIARAGREAEFAAAVARWLAAEPLAVSAQVLTAGVADGARFGDRPRPRGVRAELAEVRHGDGPRALQVADDRPRAAALLRACVPDELVESGSVEGSDWRL